MDQDPDIPRTWGWLVRRSHRTAFRLDREQFVKYSARRPDDPEPSVVGRVLLAISLVLFIGVLATAAYGVALVMHGGGLAFFGGTALILVAIMMRPRLGRLPRKRMRLSRADCPVLYSLVDRVAQAAGTRAPDVIAVDFAYNASTWRAGLRQRRVLNIGMPMWLILEPQQRVALLAHELGHQVNGDPVRGLLVQPAMRTFGVLAQHTHVSRRAFDRAMNDPRRSGRGAALEVLFMLVMKVFSSVCLLIHTGLTALGFRDHQRAEYLADGIAVDVAGSSAMVGLADRMIMMPQIANIVGYSAETKTVAQWRSLAENLHQKRAGELPVLRQLSIRHTSLWEQHPPTGLRVRMVEAWPATEPRVSVTPEESSAIHRELRDWYKATHVLILGPRSFRGSNN